MKLEPTWIKLRLNVWSLLQKTALCIKYPKEANPSYAFNHGGDYLAVTARKDCKDSISIYETKEWSLVKSFNVATQNLAGICFSYDDTVIAIWDTVLEYKLLIYLINGQCLLTYSAYQWAPGIKSVCWSPTSQFIALLGLDQQITILNHLTWKVISTFKHCSAINDSNCVIYKEVEKTLTGFPAVFASIHDLSSTEEITYMEEENRPVILSMEDDSKTYLNKPSNATIAFSTDGKYLASFSDSITHVVWVWSLVKLALVAVLVQCNPIKDISWNPKYNCLAICTGDNRVFLWMPYGCLAVKLPNCNDFVSTYVRWQCDGSLLAVLAKDKFLVAHITANEMRQNSDIS